MYNRFEQYIPSQFNLPKTDLGILANVLEAKQRRYDTAYELASKLSDYGIDALPQDRARANTILADWETKKNDIVNNYNGDYAAAYRDLSSLEQNIRNQMKPGGEANAIIANKQAFSNWYSEMSKDKEVNPDSLNLAYNYYMNPESKGYYSGVGEKNPLTQSYNVLNPEQIIAYTNPDTVVLPAIKELEASGFEKEWDSIGGQWIMRNKQSGEELTADEITRTAFRSLANDKNYFNSLKQIAKFRGEENYDPTEYAIGLAQNYGRDYAYSKVKQSQTISPNEWSMAKYKADRDDARQQKLLNDMSQVPTQRGTLDYSENMLGKDLSIGNFTRSGTQWSDITSDIANSIIPGAGAALSVGNWALDTPEAALKRGALFANEDWGKRFMTKIIESGSFEAEGGNVPLMQTIIANSPEKITGAELLARYNQQKKNIGSALKPATDIFSKEAGIDYADQFLKGTAGQYTTISMSSPGKGTQNISYKDFMSQYGKDIYDDKGNVKEKYKIMNVKTDGSDGYTPGFVMKMDDGTTVKFAAPPAYTRAKQPIIDLTQAYHNSNGESQTAGIPGFTIPYLDPKSGQILEQDWSSSPMKMKINYQKDSYGNLQPVKQLYEFVRTNKYPEGHWEKAKFKTNDYKGNIVEQDLTIDMINTQLNEKALMTNFNTYQDTKENRFTNDAFGNKIRIQ